MKEKGRKIIKLIVV